jgi:hypothetical protein
MTSLVRLDGRDPVSPATLAVYKGCASIMRAYSWDAAA